MKSQNRWKRIGSVCLSLVLVISLFAVGSKAFEKESNPEGIDFNRLSTYKTCRAYSEEIRTFEATLYFPLGYRENGGVLLGNGGSGDEAYNLEIVDGAPCLRLMKRNSSLGILTEQRYTFSKVNVYTGEWVHLAIVKDESARQMRCYIDGNLKQTKDVGQTVSLIPGRETIIGGDYRGKYEFFKGRIREIKLYEDVRTEAEIVSDARGGTGDSLIAHYDFTTVTTAAADIPDAGAKGYDLVSNVWISANQTPASSTYDYSFAVVGDTQYMTYKWGDNLGKVYDYLSDSATIANQRLRFVFGLGDITQTYKNNEVARAEWVLAASKIDKLTGKIPHLLVRGNHDWSSLYSEYMTVNRFGQSISGSFDGTTSYEGNGGGSMLNTYQELTVGGKNYLMIGLDYGANDTVLAWAK